MVKLAMYGPKQSTQEILRQYKLALEANSSAFKIRLSTRQLPREICIFSNVCQQIIAKAKLS